MATPRRRRAVTNGQLAPEFRSRVQSGFQITEHHPRLAALIAELGEPCWLSGPTAAALHGFEGFRLAEPFHVLVPRGRNVQRIGVVVHTAHSVQTIDCESRSGLPVMSPTRTLIDLGAMADPGVLTAALDGALRDRLVSEDFLLRRIAALRGRGRYGVPTLLAVIEGVEITRGAHSWLEREFLRLVAATGLPEPGPQQVLGRHGDRLIRVDFRFAGTPVVVEVLGYRWHRTGAQMRIDAERSSRLALSGYLVLQFTYSDIVERPDYVIAVVVEALAGAAQRSA